MSNQSEDPDFIRIEDIVDIPKFFQRPRTPYTSEEMKALRDDIEKESRERSNRPSGLRAPIGVCVAESITPLPQFKGKMFLFDGHARFTIEKQRGIQRLQLGREVYIDRSITTAEKLLEKAVRANLFRKGLSWDSEALYTEMFTDFGWTQQQIADMFHKDRSTISKYLTIVQTLKEVKGDPFFGTLGFEVALAICPIWGKKQWLKPYSETDKQKTRNAKGEVEVDVGRALFERWKEKGAPPTAKRVREIVGDLQGNITLPNALGSEDYDKSAPGVEGRFNKSLGKLNESLQEVGSPPLPVRTADELRAMFEEMGKNAPRLSSDERYVVESIRDTVDSFQQGLKKEEWKGQRAEVLLDTVNGFLGQVKNSLDGVVKQSKERELRESSSKLSSTAIPDRPSLATGIRKHFEPGELVPPVEQKILPWHRKRNDR